MKRWYIIILKSVANLYEILLKSVKGWFWCYLEKFKAISDYQDEFDYLINAGITLEVKAISNPTFPLIESSSKNLIKLYLNDVGILTNVLYKHNIRAVLDDDKSINLGTVYESVVASELKAHGHKFWAKNCWHSYIYIIKCSSVPHSEVIRLHISRHQSWRVLIIGGSQYVRNYCNRW